MMLGKIVWTMVWAGRIREKKDGERKITHRQGPKLVPWQQGRKGKKMI